MVDAGLAWKLQPPLLRHLSFEHLFVTEQGGAEMSSEWSGRLGAAALRRIFFF